MKIRTDWNIDDRLIGMIVIYDKNNKGLTQDIDNLSYLLSIAYIISYNGHTKDKTYGLISLGDGMTMEYQTKDALVRVLNDQGYIPCDNTTMHKIIDYKIKKV